jgi:1-phosphofructokinase family hexose kinase
MNHVLCVSLNPTLQRTLTVNTLNIGDVNRCTQVLTDAAGKGLNTARVLTQLGTAAVHLTHVGGDHTETYLRLAAEDFIPMVYARCGTSVRICTTIIDRGTKTATELVEEPIDIPGSVQTEIMELFRRDLGNSWMLIISGSIAPGYTPKLYAEMVREARERNVSVLLDIRGQQLRECLVHRPDFIKINAHEFVQTFCEHDSQEEIACSMQQLYEQYGITTIVTDGPNATRYVSHEGIFHIYPRAIVPVNPIGSGDAFTAGFVHALHAGEPISQCISLGQECGILNAGVLRPGRLPSGFDVGDYTSS